MVPMLALLFSGAETVSTPSTTPPPLEIPYEAFTLGNGLQVILSEDHSVPFVQVNLWYGVGSKDETPGLKGFAHLFEHLMFQGSQHQDGEYFAPLMPIGARVNGTTNTDRTNFFEGVPSEYLPLALWLESDRMGWLLPALTDAKLQNQKDVVRNERRENYENRPYGEVWIWLAEALYPEGHPYRVPTIGLHEDIEAATLDDVKAFFAAWYGPNNAQLSIAGDFDPAVCKDLVQKYFGDIPAVAEPAAVTEAKAALTEEKVVRKTDDVPHQRVWIAWLTPAIYDEGDAALDLGSAILADGKDSPLYKRLVREKQIAKEISAYQASSMLQSRFVIEATASEGHTTDEIVAEVDKVLAEVMKKAPANEAVDVARLKFERGFYENLQTIQWKADLLNNYAYHTGDPGFIDEDLARYQTVDAQAVQTALQAWLGNKNRVVLHVVPEKKP